MKERLAEITQKWFLSEEALFMTFCTHQLTENSGMKCPMRVGKGNIEVNPDLCADMTDRELEERLRIEIIRILLKHPYDRQPEGCCNMARALGSNCVIADAYKMHKVQLEEPHDFGLPSNGHYEFYARQIQRLLPQSNNSSMNNAEDEQHNGGDDKEGDSQNREDEEYDNDGKNVNIGRETVPQKTSEIAQNWEQDELLAAQIDETIKDVKSWGSLPEKLVEQIKASTKARIDYRKVLAGFRASIISQARKLTRMRPNRRAGFEAMGSRYDFTTSMIIGVDDSGSITTEDLQNFYSTINRFFQYGIQQIDVVQFDTTLGEVQTLSKAAEKVTVTGRGGTNFQPFIDFVASQAQYDGALIYTDGYAYPPTIPASMRTPLCWVLRSEEELKQHQQWMQQSGKVCVIEK